MSVFGRERFSLPGSVSVKAGIPAGSDSWNRDWSVEMGYASARPTGLLVTDSDVFVNLNGPINATADLLAGGIDILSNNPGRVGAPICASGPWMLFGESMYSRRGHVLERRFDFRFVRDDVSNVHAVSDGFLVSEQGIDEPAVLSHVRVEDMTQRPLRSGYVDVMCWGESELLVLEGEDLELMDWRSQERTWSASNVTTTRSGCRAARSTGKASSPRSFLPRAGDPPVAPARVVRRDHGRRDRSARERRARCRARRSPIPVRAVSSGSRPTGTRRTDRAQRSLAAPSLVDVHTDPLPVALAIEVMPHRREVGRQTRGHPLDRRAPVERWRVVGPVNPLVRRRSREKYLQ